MHTGHQPARTALPRGLLAVAVALSLAVTFALVLSGCKHGASQEAPKIKWQFSTDDRIISTPALAADGTIYFASIRLLFALAPDGTLKWKYFPGQEIRTSPIVGPDGVIYVMDVLCALHALNPDGTKRWIVEVGHFFPGLLTHATCVWPSTPAFSRDGLLLVGTGAGFAFALDPSTGATRNQIAPVDASGSPEVSQMQSADSPKISDGDLAVEGGGALQLFNAAGNVLWTVRLAPGGRTVSFRSAAITNDGRIVAAGWDDKLHVYDFQGRPQWEFAGQWAANPVIASDGTIYVSDTDGVVALRENGTQLWRVPVTWPGSPALAADGTLYVSGQVLGRDNEGRFQFDLCALRREGAVKWKLPVDGKIEGGPAIAPDGTLYFGTDSTINPGPELHLGTLYAVGENNGGLMRGGWPKSFGSPTNDGRAPTAP
jgi:outer membrane protein assembly factor BamB